MWNAIKYTICHKGGIQIELRFNQEFEHSMVTTKLTQHRIFWRYNVKQTITIDCKKQKIIQQPQSPNNRCRFAVELESPGNLCCCLPQQTTSTVTTSRKTVPTGTICTRYGTPTCTHVHMYMYVCMYDMYRCTCVHVIHTRIIPQKFWCTPRYNILQINIYTQITNQSQEISSSHNF